MTLLSNSTSVSLLVTVLFGSVQLSKHHAKSLQSCPTLCDSIDGSPPGSAVPGILQARKLEWAAIGTWNVRSKNQDKLEVVKQEMARVNVDILGIRELKWTGMGEFNSDDHYVYYCGQESRRNGLAIMVSKKV